MGRELRRVPLDFSWPMNKVWGGFRNTLCSKASRCKHCDGTGSSAEYKHLHDLWYGNVPFQPSDRGSVPFTADTPAVWAFAENNVKRAPSFYGALTEQNIRIEAERLSTLWNGMWCHHLNEADVQALLEDNGGPWELTRDFVPGEGWKDKEVPVVLTAEQVNLWSLQSFGHDSGAAYTVILAELQRLGQPTHCNHCAGEGFFWPSEEDRLAYDNWEPSQPPEGPGYQLWETTSEGSPISPVFAEPEPLARWLSGNRQDTIDHNTSYETWLSFITGPGWAPTLIGASEGLVAGVQGVTAMEEVSSANGEALDDYGNPV